MCRATLGDLQVWWLVGCSACWDKLGSREPRPAAGVCRRMRSDQGNLGLCDRFGSRIRCEVVLREYLFFFFFFF